jgi:hypothetical protein
MRDTSDESEKRYYDLLRAQAPLDRLATAVKLSSAVRGLAVAAILQDDPQAPPDVVRAKLAERLYGREVRARLFPGVSFDGA